MSEKTRPTVWIKKNRIWPVAAAVVGMVLLLTACNRKPQIEPPQKQQQEQTQTENAAPEKDEGKKVPEKVKNEQPTEEVVLEENKIQTAYGELTYSEMWTDRVWYELREDGSNVQIVFHGEFGEVQAQLFALCYGAVPEEAALMGTLTAEDGTVTDVSVVMYPIIPEEDWPEDEVNELYALQESVNDLLMQLHEDPAFTPAQ